MDRNKKTTRMLLILKDEVPSQPIPLIGFIHKPTGVHEDNGAGNNIDTGQNLPQSGQNEPQQGQDLGQNVSYIGQNIPPPPPLVRHGHMFSSAFSAQEGVHEMDDEIMNTSYDNVQPMCDKTTTEDGLVTNDENMDPMNNDFQPSCDKITTQDNSLGYLTTIKDGMESDELAMCYNILTIGSSTSNDVIVEYAAYHEVLLQADQFGKVLIHHKDMRFLKGRYLDHNEHFKVGNKSFKWKYPNEISKNLTNDNMIHDKSTNPETRNICTEQEKPHELHDSCNSTTNHSFSAVTENQNLFEPIQTRSQLSTLQESRNDTEASNIDSAIACEAKSLRSGVVEDETEIGCGVKSGASFEDGRSEVSDDVDDEVKDPTYIENDDDVSDSDCDDCSDIYPAITEVSADANVCCALSKATQTQNIRIVATEESSNAGIRKADNVKLQGKGLPKVGCLFKYDKLNSCTFCKKLTRSKISRHLLLHDDKPEIRRIKMLPKKSEERATEFFALVNEGNYKNNIRVLTANKGILITRRRDKAKHSVEDYYPCEFCKGFYVKRSLWSHSKTCKVRKHGHGNVGNIFRNSRTLLYSSLLENEENSIIPLLQHLKIGEIRRIVERDKVIKKLSAVQIAVLGSETGINRRDLHRVRQNARTLARLLLHARRKNPACTMSMCTLLRPENFDLVARCVRKISSTSDTLGTKVGHLLGHCIMTKIGWAIRIDDEQKLREANDFKILFDKKWKYVVNSLCGKMNARDLDKVSQIPETQGPINQGSTLSDIEEPLQSGSDSQSWSKRRGAQAEKRSADSSDEENEDEVTRSSLRKKSKLKKRIMIEDETDSEEMSDSTSKQPSAEKPSVVDSVEEEKEDEVTRSRLWKKSKFEKKRVIEDETDSEEMSDSASKQPSGTSTKKLVRKRWTDEENKTFTDIFRSEIIGKTMPFASKLQRAAKELKGRSIQQIRTKINNIILDKQKFVLH